MDVDRRPQNPIAITLLHAQWEGMRMPVRVTMELQLNLGKLIAVIVSYTFFLFVHPIVCLCWGQLTCLGQFKHLKFKRFSIKHA